MGSIEKSARRMRKLGAVQQAILSLVLLAGALAAQRIAPDVLASLKRNPKYARQFGYRATKKITALARDGLITFEEKRGRRYARITESGKRALMLRGNVLAGLIKRPRRWDERWRIVIFDIPERNRGTRARLRHMMRSFGFYPLQQSVWVHPYDCEDVIALTKAELRLGASVLYLIVEKLEHDQHLKEEFMLK